MSKRRRKARGRTGKLPRDSPNWMPVAEAHRLLTDLLDNGDLAAKDLTAAVAAKRFDKRLPCMQRAIPRHITPDQDWEIVPLSFWDKYEFGLDVSGRLEILRKNRFPPYAVEFPIPVAFFVWKPKFEEIWPELAASAAPHSASSARDDESTPAPTARTDDKLQRRMPGPQPELTWRTALARELIRRARAGEPEPTAEQMCELVQDRSGKPDLRTVQKEMKRLLS
jgi:hypothetical protein